LWKQYVSDYCTVGQLARKYQKSEKWIRTQLDRYQFPGRIIELRSVVVVADAMFFGRLRGVVVMRDPHKKKTFTGTRYFPNRLPYIKSAYMN